MKSILPRALIASFALAGLAGPARAALTALGPTPYLSFADSPFIGGSFDYFHLETFEDHLLNAPGVSASAGGVTSVVFGPSIHDSVDSDDGVIDGSGLKGDSYYSGAGSSGIRFMFDAATLGSLPTRVGIVWTDGGAGASITFAAYGPGDVLLYSTTRTGIPDGSNDGQTAEDRFFGVVNTTGISAIFISNSSGGIEVDHLQYGASTIPEPQVWLSMLAGLCAVGGACWRRRSGR